MRVQAADVGLCRSIAIAQCETGHLRGIEGWGVSICACRQASIWGFGRQAALGAAVADDFAQPPGAAWSGCSSRVCGRPGSNSDSHRRRTGTLSRRPGAGNPAPDHLGVRAVASADCFCTNTHSPNDKGRPSCAVPPVGDRHAQRSPAAVPRTQLGGPSARATLAGEPVQFVDQVASDRGDHQGRPGNSRSA
jgi:hypothetical protein